MDIMPKDLLVVGERRENWDKFGSATLRGCNSKSKKPKQHFTI